MPRQPLGERALTAAERQARYRAARTTSAPVIRTRRPADHRSRAQRWHDAVATLTALQAEYAIWLGLDRGSHLGQRSCTASIEAGHMNAVDHPSEVSPMLLNPRGRPHKILRHQAR